MQLGKRGGSGQPRPGWSRSVRGGGLPQAFERAAIGNRQAVPVAGRGDHAAAGGVAAADVGDAVGGGGRGNWRPSFSNRTPKRSASHPPAAKS